MAEEPLYLLRYRYQVGDVQRHRQTTTQILEEPSGLRLAGRAICQLEQKVVSESCDGYLVELKQRIEHQEGDLGPTLLSEVPPQGVRLVLTERGGSSAQPEEPPPFPEQPVAVGQAWQFERQLSEAASAPTAFQLERVEGQVAHLVSCSLAAGQDGNEMELRATQELSLKRGVLLRSQTVSKVQRADGTRITLLVETQLLS